MHLGSARPYLGEPSVEGLIRSGPVQRLQSSLLAAPETDQRAIRLLLNTRLPCVR